MEGPSNGFKWFGEGFDGFPKTLPDDCVQYTLYIIDERLNEFEIREQLRKIQTAAASLCKSMLKGYIWQRDDFRMELKKQEGLSFLHGSTNFGDSIEDEWLVVYLLRELSRQFSNGWVRVIDSDGEFLLVEAAEALPKWLNPEVAENRVWINDGKLLIIPKEGKQDEARDGALKLASALAFIQGRRSDLLHPQAIQSEAFHRLQKYPAKIEDTFHHARVRIPRRLAYVLHKNVGYISPAVEAFYLRDPISLKPLRLHRPSGLFFPPEDLVTVSVKFTKVGFAQVKSQSFDTPQAWTGWITKLPSTVGQAGYEIGMKIACGFEMLLSDPQNVDKKSVREIKLHLEDIDAGEDHLPSDEDIKKWDFKEDDESWLDIDFQEFERELSGKGGRDPLGQSAGFGDQAAHENLRKMVSRFEKFMNEDDGGAQDAEFLDDMDEDNDSDTSGGSVSGEGEGDGGEEDVEFDEDRFASMMKEMMGLPSTEAADAPIPPHIESKPKALSSEESDSINEEEEMRKAMMEMEAELRDAGALEPPSENNTHKEKSLPSTTGTSREAAISRFVTSPDTSKEQSFPDEEGELNIDFNRAKVLLSRLAEP